MSHIRKPVRSQLAAALVALSFGVYGVNVSGEPAPGMPLSQIGIDNFGQVNPGYYRGAQPEGRDYADLARLGVKTVIDLQRDFDGSEAAQVRAAGMAFHRIAMTTRTPPTAEQQAFFLKLVNEPANQPVYVHCKGGKHRTGVMTALYRMTVQRWTPDQAFREMKRYKFGMDFLHPEFKRFVYAFQPGRSPALPTVLAVETPGVTQ
jgi:protein tyrosine/serine phosphatase